MGGVGRNVQLFRPLRAVGMGSGRQFPKQPSEPGQGPDGMPQQTGTARTALSHSRERIAIASKQSQIRAEQGHAHLGDHGGRVGQEAGRG